jgi:hypothetical protein
VVEVMGEAETLVFISFPMEALFRKRIGKSNSVSIRKRTIESSRLTQRRFT